MPRAGLGRTFLDLPPVGPQPHETQGQRTCHCFGSVGAVALLLCPLERWSPGGPDALVHSLSLHSAPCPSGGPHLPGPQAGRGGQQDVFSVQSGASGPRYVTRTGKSDLGRGMGWSSPPCLYTGSSLPGWTPCVGCDGQCASVAIVLFLLEGVVVCLSHTSHCIQTSLRYRLEKKVCGCTCGPPSLCEVSSLAGAADPHAGCLAGLCWDPWSRPLSMPTCSEWGAVLPWGEPWGWCTRALGPPRVLGPQL